VLDSPQLAVAPGHLAVGLNGTLAKIGLEKLDHDTIIRDRSRWNDVSEMLRAAKGRQSTTNSIKGVQGHLIDQTVGGHRFGRSLRRIFETMTSSTRHFAEKHCHRFERVVDTLLLFGTVLPGRVRSESVLVRLSRCCVIETDDLGGSRVAILSQARI
jgi:hypothetical protein